MKRTIPFVIVVFLVVVVIGLVISSRIPSIPGDHFEGVIEKYWFNDEGIVTKLVLFDSEQGKYFKVYLANDTKITASTVGIEPDGFIYGQYGRVWISGRGSEKPSRRGMYYADIIDLDEVLTDERVQLSDGTNLSVWKTANGIDYKFEDGLRLLSVGKCKYPDMNLATFYENPPVSEMVKNRILEYYTQQGSLYSLDVELETAYRLFQDAKKEGRRYSCSVVRQATYVSLITEKEIVCTTELISPSLGGIKNEKTITIYFDKYSGELSKII